MKKLLGFSSALSLVLFVGLQTGVSSCTKETIVHDTVKVTNNVIIKDTVLISKDTMLTVQRLTANQWKLQELRGVAGNANVLYVRGGSANTSNYDNEYAVFNANGTGTYYDPNGFSSSFTWSFSNTANTKLVRTIAFPTVTTVVTWDNIVYRDGKIYYDEYFTQGSTNAHLQAIRIIK